MKLSLNTSGNQLLIQSINSSSFEIGERLSQFLGAELRTTGDVTLNASRTIPSILDGNFSSVGLSIILDILEHKQFQLESDKAYLAIDQLYTLTDGGSLSKYGLGMTVGGVNGGWFVGSDKPKLTFDGKVLTIDLRQAKSLIGRIIGKSGANIQSLKRRLAPVHIIVLT